MGNGHPKSQKQGELESVSDKLGFCNRSQPDVYFQGPLQHTDLNRVIPENTGVYLSIDTKIVSTGRADFHFFHRVSLILGDIILSSCSPIEWFLPYHFKRGCNLNILFHVFQTHVNCRSQPYKIISFSICVMFIISICCPLSLFFARDVLDDHSKYEEETVLFFGFSYSTWRYRSSLLNWWRISLTQRMKTNWKALHLRQSILLSLSAHYASVLPSSPLSSPFSFYPSFSISFSSSAFCSQVRVVKDALANLCSLSQAGHNVTER